jgi:hypothetical protein
MSLAYLVPAAIVTARWLSAETTSPARADRLAARRMAGA